MIHSVSQAMCDGDLDEAEARFQQLKATHPYYSTVYLAVAVINDYLDVFTPTNDVAPDAHLDDVGD